MDVAPIACLLIGGAAGAGAVAALYRSRIKRRETEVRAAERRAAAERLAELQSMTGGLAHEIKNPLSTLVLNAQLMREELLDMELEEATRQRVVRRIDALARESGRLREILDDFLKFAGRIQLDRQRCDVRELVDELADFFRPQADQAGVLLRVDLPALPVFVLADAGLLKQALLNLMLNATQAMSGAQEAVEEATAPSPRAGADAPRRELLVRVESDGDAESAARPAADAAGVDHAAPHEVRIHVIDTGPGIEEARRESIFRPYASTKPGGTGLGLATTRRIAEEHGGRITLFSEPGIGSDFVICLPRDDGSAARQRPAAAAGTAGTTGTAGTVGGTSHG